MRGWATIQADVQFMDRLDFYPGNCNFDHENVGYVQQHVHLLKHFPFLKGIRYGSMDYAQVDKAIESIALSQLSTFKSDRV